MEQVVVKPINFKQVTFDIRSTAPLVMAKFSSRTSAKLQKKYAEQEAVSKKAVREKRDYTQDCVDALHVSVSGQYGIPCAAFRAAMIRACSLVKFKMTVAKMTVFVVADAVNDQGEGLVLINTDGWEEFVLPVRNANMSNDIRARPLFKSWDAKITLRFDEDQFTVTDVANLLERAGHQVGVLEGRPSSTNSNGMGWGTFELVKG